MKQFILIANCFFLIVGCTDYRWDATFTTIYVNETNDTIFTNLLEQNTSLECPFDFIAPNKENQLSHKQTFQGSKKSEHPIKEDINYIGKKCRFYYGNTNKCEKGIFNISNYDEAKDLGGYNFEYTFRFTEEKKANADSCE